MPYALLPEHGFISIKGDDRAAFLQGLITQDVRLVEQGQMIYACFLTPQGKYLADFFVAAWNDTQWLLEVHRDLLPDLLKRLSMYKLRSKVELMNVSDQFYAAWVWQENVAGKSFTDPRAADIGQRIWSQEKIVLNGESGNAENWRLQNGLPNRHDAERERSSMADLDMDFLNAIAWDKGCYLGQELTARMHYRALVKKRLLPLVFCADCAAAFDTSVMHDGKTIGRLRSANGKHALALLQLEGLADGMRVSVGEQQAVVVFPAWWPVDGAEDA